MTCDEVRELLHAFADGQLEGAGHEPVQQHLAACEGCAGELIEIRRLSAQVRAAGRHELPAGLREQVQASLRQAPAGRAATRLPRWADRGLAGGVGLAAGVALMLLVSGGNPDAELLGRELVSAHLRSLEAGRLVDVTSGNPHAVKPWFNGRLDFAPKVEDLSAAGFPLIGGRTDYLAGRQVAALAFKRREHVINLFVLPAVAAGEPPATAPLSRLGFDMVTWRESDLDYWAISDVRREDLELLRQLLRPTPSPPR